MKKVSFSRIRAMIVARNHEFFRDKAAFGWNFAFPFLIILGFGLMFNDRELKQFNVGIFPAASAENISASTIPESFAGDNSIKLIPVEIGRAHV